MAELLYRYDPHRRDIEEAAVVRRYRGDVTLTARHGFQTITMADVGRVWHRTRLAALVAAHTATIDAARALSERYLAAKREAGRLVAAIEAATGEIVE